MAAFDLAQQLVRALSSRSLTITTAESCTGGLIAAAITDIAGASSVFKQGIISYDNSAKTTLLGVNAALLQLHGAVSAEVVQAMAKGALKNAPADMAIAISGIAGPDGGSVEKPVGLVFIAVATQLQCAVQKYQFTGDRAKIRSQAVEAALALASASLP